MVSSILATSPSLLPQLPFPSDLVAEVDHILLSLSRKHDATSTGVSYHGILYSWRVSRENYRGAAEGLFERLQTLKATTDDLRDDVVSSDKQADDVLETYLLLINTLACCGPDEGWILAELGPVADRRTSMNSLSLAIAGKRRIVTLDDVRAEYQAELDRRSEIAHGRFALFAPERDGMEIDVL